ncbi:unnamed protein product [Parajaminaea phylloscopi]
MAVPSPADLVPSLRSHNASFLSLLSLIPPQFYLSPLEEDEDAEQGLNTKFMKNTKRERKAAAAQAAAQAAADRKDKKRRKLDPEVVSKTVLDVQEERRKKQEAKDGEMGDLSIEGMDDDEDDDDEDDDDDDAQTDSDEDNGDETAVPEGDDEATPFGRGTQPNGQPQTKSDSITSLRQRLADKIAALQSRRGGNGPSGANAIAVNPNGAHYTNGSAGDDDESMADEDGSASLLSVDPDASVASTRDELLEERRRKRGEMRDKRRRERKELRRQAATQAANAAASSSSQKGNQTKNGASGPAATKGVRTSAPGLLVSEGGDRNGRASAAGSGMDGSDVAFSNLQFAGDEDGKKKKLDRNALPSDPKQALEILQARKKKEAARKAAQGGETSDGDDAGPSSSTRTAGDDAAAWSKATSAAKGVKIRDDEKLLRKAVKRKEKLKTKSSVEWKERQRDVEKKQSDAQQRRQDNLTQRKEVKKAKKMGKKLPTDPKKKKTGGAPGGGKRTKDRKLGSGSASSSRSGKPAGRGGSSGAGSGGRAGFEGKKFGGGGRKGGK